MLVLPAKGGMVANCCSRILPACRSWKGGGRAFSARPRGVRRCRGRGELSAGNFRKAGARRKGKAWPEERFCPFFSVRDKRGGIRRGWAEERKEGGLAGRRGVCDGGNTRCLRRLSLRCGAGVFSRGVGRLSCGLSAGLRKGFASALSFAERDSSGGGRAFFSLLSNGLHARRGEGRMV